MSYTNNVTNKETNEKLELASSCSFGLKLQTPAALVTPPPPLEAWTYEPSTTRQDAPEPARTLEGYKVLKLSTHTLPES